MMEDYRAGFQYDTEFDAEDRAAGNQIECPSLALYAEGKSGTNPGPNPVKVWEDWMTDVRGETVDAGHFFPEEKPTATVEALRSFFDPDR
jgi:haloacetate dehalogenase